MQIASRLGALLPASSRPWQAARRWAWWGLALAANAASLGRFAATGAGDMSVYFRGAGFSPDADGRAQPAAAKAAVHRHRRLRNQTRRRIPDVEPVHRRPRSRWRGSDWRRWRGQISTSSLAASGSATPRRPCSKIRGAIADRGRCVGRGDRVARAGPASARQATDRRSALPPRQWRLLRDVGIPPMASIRSAGPPLRRGAGGYRPLAAKPAASAPRRAVRAGGAAAACRTSASRRRFRAVVERSAG